MLWPQDKYDVAFRKIKEDALCSGCTVLIFVAPTCDGICACRIVTALLRAEDVSYKVKPVSGYNELYRSHAELVHENNDIRSIILINCGGRVSLPDTFPLAENATCYVIDSHRPVDLNNVYAGSQYVIFSDELLAEEDIPSEDEYSDDEEDEPIEVSDQTNSTDHTSPNNESSGLEGETEFSFDDAADESDNTSSSPGSDGGNVRKRRRTEEDISITDSNDSADIDSDTPKADSPQRKSSSIEDNSESNPAQTLSGNHEDEEGEEDTQQDRKRIRTIAAVGTAAVTAETRRMERQRREKEYYRGSYYGMPASYVLYFLSQQLNRSTNDMIWLAIVGLTDHYLHHHLDNTTYNGMVLTFEQEVQSRATQQDRIMTALDGTVVPVAENGRIIFEQDLRFMLYRHWSLYEAMYNSNIIASRLKIWKSDGKGRLNEFLAQCGIPLTECKERYAFMRTAVKNRLVSMLKENAGEFFGDDDIVFGTFIRQEGYSGSITSAADCAYSITALLEAAHIDTNSTVQEQGVTGSSSSSDASSSTSATTDPARDREASESTLDKNFNEAYDALSISDQSHGQHARALLKRGIEMSMSLQSAVMRQSVSIIENRRIVNAGPFRYTYLDTLSDGDLRFFSYPMALSKLALFVVQAHRDMKKWVGKSARPFLIAVLNAARTSYLVVGVNCPEDESGSIGGERNNFGHAFLEAAEQIEAHYKLDGFETSVMEIAKNDLFGFIESLHVTLMNEYR